MSRPQYAPTHSRDSLELASLASSSPGQRTSTSSRSGISSSRRLSLEQEDPLDSNNRASKPRIANRSFSISSAFNYTQNLFPLSSTQGNGYAPIGAPVSASDHPTALGGGSLEKHKALTYVNGLSLVVGLIIGSGIFSSPSQVNGRAGSPGAALIIWATAGVLAWTGGASYAELGGAIPLNGGAQVYLSKIFGELSGFLFTWCAVIVLKPGSAAIIAIIFGEYLVQAAVGAEAEKLPDWISKVVALIGLLLVTVINCASTKMATKIGDTFTLFKFVALFGITITGVVVAATGFSMEGKANTDWKDKSWFAGTSTDTSSWAVALYAGLWAFDGWDNTNYVVGEFRRPGRDLPRVIHTAMPLVILSYLLANISYFLVLPLSVTNSSNTIAVIFGHKVFGPIGSLIIALVVSASCFGALNATTFTSGRLVYTAGREGYVPTCFGKIGFGNYSPTSSISHPPTQSWRSRYRQAFGDGDEGFFSTPINAMVLNATLTAFYIVMGEFATLLTFYGVAGYSFYFLTVLGLIVLRVQEPNLERPYKTWITTPIIFCCVSIFLLTRSAFAEPLQTVIVLAFVAAGVPVFYWRLKGRDGVGKARGREGGDEDEEKVEWWRFWRRWR